MKKSMIFVLFLSLFVFANSYGQRGSLLLTFHATGYYSQDTLLLDSVYVENPARNCDTTVYGTPSQLLLIWTTGIDEFTNKNGWQVTQNYPNPFFKTTTFTVSLSGETDIKLSLANVYGTQLAVWQRKLQQGAHTFAVETATEGIYFLTVSNGKTTKTLKLNSMATSGRNSFRIRYTGNRNIPEDFKAGAQGRGFTFLPGDELEFTPYANGYESDTYSATPATDYTAYFVLKPNRLDFEADTCSGYAPFLVHFYPSSNLPGIVQWHWDFGDGETSGVRAPEHVYQTQDTTYSVSLTVTTDYNETITVEKTDFIKVLHDLASVNFTADHLFGIAPLTVQFTGYTNVDPVVHWIWDFGDGETAQDVQNPIHTYEEGMYSVYLEVWGEEGIVWERKIHYIQVYPDALCPSTVTDADGNVYGVTQIGEQCWMTENLNVGTMILKGDGSYSYQTDNNVTEKYCYDNDIEYCGEYGGLYQWDEAMQYSLEDGARGLCPYGWHIPTDEEWKVLEEFVDGYHGWDNTGWRGRVVAFLLKVEGDPWYGEGEGYYGFAMLPGGVGSAGFPGFFYGAEPDYYGTALAAFWTSTKELQQVAWMRLFTNWWGEGNNKKSYRSSEDRRNNAFAVRCIKDSDK